MKATRNRRGKSIEEGRIKTVRTLFNGFSTIKTGIETDQSGDSESFIIEKALALLWISIPPWDISIG